MLYNFQKKSRAPVIGREVCPVVITRHTLFIYMLIALCYNVLSGEQ